jgi:hypothetical protein
MAANRQGLAWLMLATALTLSSVFKIGVLIADQTAGELGRIYERYAAGPAFVLWIIGPILALVAAASAAWAAYRAQVGWIRTTSLIVLVAAIVLELAAQVWFASSF